MLKTYSIAQNQFQQCETKDRHIGIILLPFKFDFSLVTGISVCISARAKLHHRVKFRRNRSNHGRVMAIFRFSKMAAAVILDFQNFKFLKVERLKRVQVRCRAKFSRNRSNRGRDMAIFLLFKMAAAVILNF